MAKTVEIVAWKAAKGGANMLRNAELENEALQIKGRQLKLDNVALGFTKSQAEKESTQLKLKLEQT